MDAQNWSLARSDIPDFSIVPLQHPPPQSNWPPIDDQASSRISRDGVSDSFQDSG